MVPHGTDRRVSGKPHGEPGAPHGAGRRGDMADEDKPTEGAGGNEPHGEEPDYEAHYKAEKAHSRKWEKQARANRSAADELEKAREAGKTADEQIAELTKRRDEKEKAEQRAKLAAKVAEKKGMPVELVVGDEEESMEAFADKMLTHFKKKPAAKVDKPTKLVVYQSECHCSKTGQLAVERAVVV